MTIKKITVAVVAAAAITASHAPAASAGNDRSAHGKTISTLVQEDPGIIVDPMRVTR